MKRKEEIENLRECIDNLYERVQKLEVTISSLSELLRVAYRGDGYEAFFVKEKEGK